MIEKLACNLGRKDEEPNIELAREIAQAGGKGIAEIVAGLQGPDKNVSNDCIKVLYETGKINPALISPYTDEFIRLLKSRNNRMVWGSMIALSLIASEAPEKIFSELPLIMKAYENGSVITVDYCVSVFANLAACGPEYEKKVFPIIIKHLQTCRPKEAAQHAERAFVSVNKDNAQTFRHVLEKRRDVLSDSQRKRVDKIIKKIENGVFGNR